MTGVVPQLNYVVKILDHLEVPAAARHLVGQLATVTAITTDKDGQLAVCLSHSHMVGDEELWLHANLVEVVSTWA